MTNTKMLRTTATFFQNAYFYNPKWQILGTMVVEVDKKCLKVWLTFCAVT